MVNDPISNLIVSLKNASIGGKDVLEIPYTKMNHSILDTLEKVGYIDGVEKHGKKVNKKLKASLKYDGDNSVITDVKRVSKFSKRVYAGAKDLRPVRNGYGLSILSTPKGILSNIEAKKANLGGEILFEIW